MFDSVLTMSVGVLLGLGGAVKKNPAYGRHQLSWPMRIVGPIQIWRGCVIFLPPSPPPLPTAVAAAKGLLGKQFFLFVFFTPQGAELVKIGFIKPNKKLTKKKWSQIVKILLMKGLKSPCKKSLFLVRSFHWYLEFLVRHYSGTDQYISKIPFFCTNLFCFCKMMHIYPIFAGIQMFLVCIFFKY